VLLRPARLWASVAGLAVDQLVAWGVLYYAYTVLSAPIARDLGVSRLVVAAAFSVCLVVAGWVGRAVGPVLDARGTRGALRVGAFAAPLVFAALACVDSVAALVGAFAVLGAVQALALYDPAFRTVVDWCPDERTRSRAMLALTSVGGFASTAFLPLTSALVTAYGWRLAALLLALVLAAVLVPIRLALPLSNRPRPATRIPATPPPASAHRLASGLAMHALASTGVSVYLMWHLVERGEMPAVAATVAGLAGAAQVPGRLLSAPLRRLVGGSSFLTSLLAVQALALGAVVLTDGALAIAAVLLFGAASGMMTLERATVLVEWYGRAAFGAHQGRLAAATSTARAVSPFVVEAGHQVLSYSLVFGLLALVLAAGAWTCASAARLHALSADAG
jgi:hypothetical protein